MRPKRGVLVRTWARRSPVVVMMELTNGERGVVFYRGLCAVDHKLMLKAPPEGFPKGIDTVTIMPVRP